MDITQAVQRFETWPTRADFPFVVIGSQWTEDDQRDQPEHIDRWPEGAAAAAALAGSIAAANDDSDLAALLATFRAAATAASKRWNAKVAAMNNDGAMAAWASAQGESTGVLSFLETCKLINAFYLTVMPALGGPAGMFSVLPRAGRRLIEVTPARARLILDLDEAYRGATLTGEAVQQYVDKIVADEWTARDGELKKTPALIPRYQFSRETGNRAIAGEFRLGHTGPEKMQAVIDADTTVECEFFFFGMQLAYTAIPWLPAATLESSVLE